MATTVAAPLLTEEKSNHAQTGADRRFGLALCAFLAVFAVVVHGYHPFAEDGGLYAAGIKYLLNPALYPHGREFVTAHLHYSIFAHVMSGLVRATGVSLEVALFVTYVASFWAMLYATWMLATRCFARREEKVGAVVLLAGWMTLPVAGTSLMLMDPYVTARSVSTPLTLLALIGVLDLVRNGETGEGRTRSLLLCGGSLVGAALVHPLMAGYGAICALGLWCCLMPERSARRRWLPGLAVAGVAGAMLLQVAAPVESAAYVRVEMTRPYWFLREWAWYEWVGALAPMVILAVAAAISARRELRALARMCVFTAGMALLVALCFSRESLRGHIVARMQPMRLLQTTYVVMIVVLGGLMGRWLLRRELWRWTVAGVALGGMMFAVNEAIFPASAHIELPHSAMERSAPNGWVRAFLWIRQNTPQNGLFAMDSRYITADGEDAQCFRAVAERSSLPDYSKDGGEAAITPALAEEWVRGQAAQSGLATESDAQRVQHLRASGASWVVLPEQATTAFECSYRNEAVKVCRVPSDPVQQSRLR